MPTFQYHNCKGERKFAEISNHAIEQFTKRWNNIKDYLEAENMQHHMKLWEGEWLNLVNCGKIEEVIEMLSKTAYRHKQKDWSKKMKERSKQYNQNTIRMRNFPFEFVVEDGMLKTIEIYEDQLRFLN